MKLPLGLGTPPDWDTRDFNSRWRGAEFSGRDPWHLWEFPTIICLHTSPLKTKLQPRSLNDRKERLCKRNSQKWVGWYMPSTRHLEALPHWSNCTQLRVYQPVWPRHRAGHQPWVWWFRLSSCSEPGHCLELGRLTRPSSCQPVQVPRSRRAWPSGRRGRCLCLDRGTPSGWWWCTGRPGRYETVRWSDCTWYTGEWTPRRQSRPIHELARMYSC